MPTLRIEDLTDDQLDWVLAHRLLPEGFVCEGGALYRLSPAGLRRPGAWSPSRSMALALELAIEHRIGVIPSGAGWIASWAPQGECEHWDYAYNTEHSAWIDAAMRCLAKTVSGLTADIPPALLRAQAA